MILKNAKKVTPNHDLICPAPFIYAPNPLKGAFNLEKKGSHIIFTDSLH
jgi:hypothetical protein